MKRIATFAAAALAVLVLAACTVEPPLPPSPPANTISVTASNDPTQPLRQVTIDVGSSQVFRVAVPDSVRSRDLLYIELDRQAPLEVMTGAYGTVTESSTSTQFFGRGATGLAALNNGGEVHDQSIGLTVPCRGSCVLLEVAPAELFVRVGHSGGGVPSSVSLYVYGDAYVDEYEPQNDQISATTPALLPIDAGAIETLDDIDYFYVPVTTSVTFNTTVGGLAVEAYRLNSSGQVLTGPHGDGAEFGVNAGDYIRVWSVDPDQAGSSGSSRYDLDTTLP